MVLALKSLELIKVKLTLKCQLLGDISSFHFLVGEVGGGVTFYHVSVFLDLIFHYISCKLSIPCKIYHIPEPNFIKRLDEKSLAPKKKIFSFNNFPQKVCVSHSKFFEGPRSTTCLFVCIHIGTAYVRTKVTLKGLPQNEMTPLFYRIF